MLSGIPGITTGKLSKMVIEAYTSPERTGPVPDDRRFEFMYNPNTFSEKYEIQYNEHQPQGNAGTELVFNRVPPKDYTFDLILDGTGASKPSFDIGLGVALPGIDALLKPVEVRDHIERFLKVAYQYEGEIHRPPYLKLIWGQAFGDSVPRSVINCVMTSADVTYTLFKPDGKPLRAKIKAVFRESKDEEFRLRQQNASSPDLSHIRSVQEGDSLPLMTHSVYKSSSHYIEVARTNRLKNFRRLRVGQELRFPPLRPAAGS